MRRKYILTGRPSGMLWRAARNMNNTATATAKETVRRPAPAAPSSAGRMTRRVGNTTYRVTLHFKENGKEDMNDKIKRLIKMGCEG